MACPNVPIVISTASSSSSQNREQQVAGGKGKKGEAATFWDAEKGRLIGEKKKGGREEEEEEAALPPFKVRCYARWSVSAFPSFYVFSLGSVFPLSLLFLLWWDWPPTRIQSISMPLGGGKNRGGGKASKADNLF